MTLPYANPALPSQPNPYFQDNSFVRGDNQRANNGFIWGNLENLDTRVEALELDFLKTIIDYGKAIGEVFFLPEEKATDLDFDPLAPRDYFPAINLSAIQGSAIFVSIAGGGIYPNAWVSKMASMRLKYFPGLSGEVDEWAVTVAGSVITFPNTVSANAVLAALVEDANAVSGGSYDRPVTIGSTNYSISTINLTSRSVTTSSAPPSGSQTAFFLPYTAGAGGTTSCKIVGMLGEAFMAPNDPDGYFIANLFTRGYFQGHWHNVLRNSDNIAFAGTSSAGPTSFGPDGTVNAATAQNLIAKTVVTDTVNGNPLTRKITHGPAYTLIPYMWCGG